jgi:hypothetical protein
VTSSAGILDEAYERLHHTGPEWGGNLANHGPMAAEVLARRGRAELVPGWVDAYVTRMEEMPAPSEPVTDSTWREALGGRVADWVVYLSRQVGERPWREVLATWWPRLLPGIAAGATHGVIRTGHAVRTLLAGDESPAAVSELAHGLGYWAARFRQVPGVSVPDGTLDPGRALDGVPRIDEQAGPIRIRLTRLADLPGWTEAVAALRAADAPDQARCLLAELVTAATLRYLRYGHASPVLLVHTATAPNAVWHTLSALPRDQWVPSLTATWAASAAITSTYAPAHSAPPAALPAAPDGSDPIADVMDRAAHHSDEHAIKLADTAGDVYERTANPDALAGSHLGHPAHQPTGPLNLKPATTPRSMTPGQETRKAAICT